MLIQEQRLRHLHELDDASVVHPALAASSTNSTGYKSNNGYTGKGKGNGNWKNNNNNRKNTLGGKRRGNSSPQNSPTSSRSMPIGTSRVNSILSCFYTRAPPSSSSFSVGNSSQLGILGSNPSNLTCQICLAPGLSALQWPCLPSTVGTTPKSFATSFTAMPLANGHEHL